MYSATADGEYVVSSAMVTDGVIVVECASTEVREIPFPWYCEDEQDTNAQETVTAEKSSGDPD